MRKKHDAGRASTPPQGGMYRPLLSLLRLMFETFALCWGPPLARILRITHELRNL